MNVQLNKETAQRQSDSLGWFGYDPFYDYMIIEGSMKTLRMKASNKKEYVIKDDAFALKYVWGKLF